MDADSKSSAIESAGGQGFYVTPKEDCPHIATIDLNQSLSNLSTPLIRGSCRKCDESAENWLCLQCNGIFCSRYVNAHMSEHFAEEAHPVAFSLADGSFWCYQCEAYIWNKDLLTYNRDIRQFLDDQTNKDD